MRPQWHEIFGSAGRAASAIAAVAGPNLVHLHCYVDSRTQDVIAARSALDGSFLSPTLVERTCRFSYYHGLALPRIDAPQPRYPPIRLQATNIVRFGMLEGEGVVEGERVVYDPQNSLTPHAFGTNGSSARELVVVLNHREAARMTQLGHVTPKELAKAVLALNSAKAVIIKEGPLGAIICDDGVVTTIPAYSTDNVWKIGSGDVFVGHFAFRWMHEGRSIVDSAILASKATALYCETSAFPMASSFTSFDKPAVSVSLRYTEGNRPTVYLAGPFFTLAQLWLIEQARSNLENFGLNVFSPYHDVGHGSADDVVELDLEAIRQSDILFAVGDGLDPGTIYEIGYARARNIPVIVYCENESPDNQKMMVGSGCIISADYVSAIYKTFWAAVAL
jgi:hypothetical protein